jgi:MFS family permease
MTTNPAKSIGAIAAGMMTVVLLSIGTDILFETLGYFPAPEKGLSLTWMLMLALVYRCLYAIAGGYVTAILAPSHGTRHAIVLGIIGFIISTIGVIVAWNMSPHWYPIALAVTSLPCTWLGGTLRKQKPVII